MVTGPSGCIEGGEDVFGWYAPVGVIGLRRKSASKGHHCGDYCHDEDRVRLDRLRNAFGPAVYRNDHEPLGLGVKHVCGPWCMQADPQTPVRLGGRDGPVSYGLDFLSPASAALLARLRGVA